MPSAEPTAASITEVRTARRWYPPSASRRSAGIVVSVPTCLPIDAVIESIVWWSTPDKYAAAAHFGTLAAAREYNSTAVISVELVLRTRDDRRVFATGGGPSIDSIWRDSDRQDPGVVPEHGAVLVEVMAADRPVGYVFRNPDGRHFVLYLECRRL